MPRSTVTLLALLAGSIVGCAHTRAPSGPATSDGTADGSHTRPSVAVADPVSEISSEEPGSFEDNSPEATQDTTVPVPQNATVLVMEAEDLGGGSEAIVAAPKRPKLGSMLSGVGMAPSH
ncbi:MAG: hypothetical protein AAGF11_06755 [Myxococcota bacterium]